MARCYKCGINVALYYSFSRTNVVVCPWCWKLLSLKEMEHLIVRNIPSEMSKVSVGKSGAVSSTEQLHYHLISPYTIKRLAERMLVGSKKYGWVQWRMGLNDEEYIADRLNHLWAHLCDFMESGDSKDDNIGAMLWALNCLIEVERLCPEVLDKIIGTCRLFGDSAREYHKEMQVKAGV